MTFIRTGLICLFTIFITACGMLSSPFEGINDDKVEKMTIAETIKSKDLYGAWAIASEDGADMDFLYIVVLMPDHVGVNYLTIDEKKGKPESVYTESYTWKFDSKNKIFTMDSYERVTKEDGKPEKSELLKEIKDYNTDLYLLDGKALAIRFVGPDGKFTFLRMDNDIYHKLVKDVPGLPKLK